MKRIYREFLLPLKSGTRSMMGLFAIVYLAQIIGEKTGTFDLVTWGALFSKPVWAGQVWRLVTYGFITPSPAVFMINILYIGMLGTWLERVWSPREWWGFCLLCTIGTGAIKLAVTPFSPIGLIGNVGMTFGLLVAWGRIFAHETVLLMGIWRMTIRSAALVFGLVNVLLNLPCSGWVNVLILLSGGIIGWFYLSFRWKLVNVQASRPLDSARISRLEL
ncbi:MAG: rane protein [Verrucomicrobiales bacterium]|nr:rane protein [Verrucomicrobiales bacterium]